MKVYRSKFGWEMLLFIALIFGAITALMAFQGILGDAWHHSIIAIAIVLGFFLYLNYATSYIVTEDGYLKVICGIFINMKVRISTIKTIIKTRSFISSPAPSLDRLLISYGDSGEVIISPQNKEEFVRDLMEVNPNIQNHLSENKSK